MKHSKTEQENLQRSEGENNNISGGTKKKEFLRDYNRMRITDYQLTEIVW